MCVAASHAQAARPVERQAVLDAVRPVAARMAGVPVRIKVDVLNVDADWALLVGELRAPSGRELNWNRTACAGDLDKMLWVVLNKSNSIWTVKHIDICAPEPPHWYLDPFGGLIWPCGVYAGLQSSEGESLEALCRFTASGKTTENKR